MFKEDFKLVFRNLIRQKIYVIINTIGLAIALTAALLIYSHIVKEWNTDRFHKNGDMIYRILDKYHTEQDWSSWTSAPVGPYMKAAYPEIKNYVRLRGPEEFRLKKSGEKEFSGRIKCVFTDPQFYEVFTFPLVAGNLPSPDEPGWIVLTESLAKRYFPDSNPVGEFLSLKAPQREEDQGETFRIVAVMRDIPSASTIQAQAIADFPVREKKNFNSWGAYGFYTYFQLRNNADVARLEKALPLLIEKNYQWIEASEHTMKLQPLKDIYFHSEHIQESISHGSKRLNLILCGITLLILILASCNYWMIKMADLSRNTAGLAIQRCFGADMRQLRRQLFLETALHVGIALVVALGITVLLHPYFIRVISPQWPYPLHFSWDEILVFLLLLWLLTESMTGLSSWYILRRLDRDGVKHTLLSRRFDLKKLLSVVQICIFSALLCCSIVLLCQMNYIKNRHLGFDNENVIQMFWRQKGLNLTTLRSVFSAGPDILSVSNGASLPLLGESPLPLIPEDTPGNSLNAYMIHGDAEYLATYCIHLCEGRNLNPENYPADLEDFLIYRPDQYREILINRKFVEKWGVKDPVGRILYENGEKKRGFKVVGVVDDFHFLTLYQAIQPAFIVYDMPFISSSILVRYRSGKRAEALSWLEKCYTDVFANSEFFYQEYDFSQLYDKDIAMVKLINTFTVIAILISGMGIFAFSVFMTASRSREVALRKVNGATTGEIVRLLNKDMIRKVAWACVVSLPMAYYGINRWLEGFTYRVTFSIWIFLLVVVISVLLVLLITTWHTWRTALRNPAHTLKGDES